MKNRLSIVIACLVVVALLGFVIRQLSAGPSYEARAADVQRAGLDDAYPGVRFRGTVVEMGRRVGRKSVRTDDPTERIEPKILEVVIDLEDTKKLVPGLRVTSYIELGDNQG